tara:strand:- start:34 stop:717 length:684 start_codon:yes stop_codon:yes gene_type:complete
MIEHKFVIHLDSATHRWEKFKDDPSYIKWSATLVDDITEEQDKRMLSYWNLPHHRHIGKCSCLDSHYRLYKHIVTNKLNDVLILEDDAVKVGEYPTEYPIDSITYLGGYFHKNKMTDGGIVDWLVHENGINSTDGSCCLMMSMSYIIPTWEIAQELVDYIDSLKRWKASDILLWKSPIKKSYLYPAVVVEEETPSLLRNKKCKSNIHYQLIKWGTCHNTVIESKQKK